ncbi:unnamed protein product [Clonostachys rosea]|uniref:Fungal N-terminal domain-containing protein n=1 Tax=Bionectria ochroleuca TaxID=29856 RepID=A0ABY6U446_BIOOC|nr:unnamed protein product [Clonostachys rosea]
MDPLLGFSGVILLANLLREKLCEVADNARTFKSEIKISCNTIVQSANSLNAAMKNLGTLCSEHTKSPIFKHIREQSPLLKEGQQVISDMLEWLRRQVQNFKGSLSFVVMWKWKSIKPLFNWLRDQMHFMLLNIYVINSTIELNILAAYVAAHGIESFPCTTRLPSKTLSRSIKDFRRQIRKLKEDERLREAQLPLEARIASSSKKYMRDSMDVIRTLKESYTPPAAAFQVLESPNASASTSTHNPESVQEQQESTASIDARDNAKVYYVKYGDLTRPNKKVEYEINVRLPINVISIYKAQELDLPIEDLEPGDPQSVRYVSSENRASNWDIVGKTLDAKLYSDSSAHARPQTISLFVAQAPLYPPIKLGQPFLKQQKDKQKPVTSH